MRNGTYNKSVYMPKIKTPRGNIEVKVTKHAVKAALTDSYGKIKLPTKINFNNYSVIEYTILRGMVNKYVLRKRHDENCDIVLVVLVENGEYILKTTWLNRRDDKHRTLNSRNYITAN